MEIDYLAELEPYLARFDKWVIKGEKLISCSPFREESHPSFAVNLTNGKFIDSGANIKGGFTRLLALLTPQTYEQVETYLESKYSVLEVATCDLKLSVNLEVKADSTVTPIDPKKYSNLYGNISPAYRYLEKRGISRTISGIASIGYSKYKNSIAFPWCNSRGEILNIKFRRLDSKKFYYLKGGNRIDQLLFCYDLCKYHIVKKLFITEAEIDCLSLWEVGEYAVALGGGNFTHKQQLLLRSSRVKEIVIATDNDWIGNSLASEIRAKLLPYFNVSRLYIPPQYKDVNGLLLEDREQLITNCNNLVSYTPNFFGTV